MYDVLPTIYAITVYLLGPSLNHADAVVYGKPIADDEDGQRETGVFVAKGG